MHTQERDGALNFATDAWTSPNSKAYIALTIHFENNGVPVSMLLNIVKVPHSHSGLNLAKAFAKVLEEFGISDKVLKVPVHEKAIKIYLHVVVDLEHNLR